MSTAGADWCLQSGDLEEKRTTVKGPQATSNTQLSYEDAPEINEQGVPLKHKRWKLLQVFHLSLLYLKIYICDVRI